MTLSPPPHWKNSPSVPRPQIPHLRPKHFLVDTIPPPIIPTSVQTIFLLLLKPCIFTPFPLILRIMLSQYVKSHIPPSSCINFTLSTDLPVKHITMLMSLSSWRNMRSTCYPSSFWKRMSALPPLSCNRSLFVLSNLAVSLPQRLHWHSSVEDNRSAPWSLSLCQLIVETFDTVDHYFLRLLSFHLTISTGHLLYDKNWG